MNDSVLWERKSVWHLCRARKHSPPAELCFSWDSGDTNLAFLQSYKATYSISLLFSYTDSVCSCFKGTVDQWTFTPILGEDFRPRCHCDSKPSPSIGCLEAWLMQDRWSCSAGIPTCPRPWLPRPMHPFFVFVHVSVGTVMQQCWKCFLLCD